MIIKECIRYLLNIVKSLLVVIRRNGFLKRNIIFLFLGSRQGTIKFTNRGYFMSLDQQDINKIIEALNHIGTEMRYMNINLEKILVELRS
jgi:hypothetical protein